MPSQNQDFIEKKTKKSENSNKILALKSAINNDEIPNAEIHSNVYNKSSFSKLNYNQS